PPPRRTRGGGSGRADGSGPAAPSRRRSRVRAFGLRTRLLAAFLLVAAVSAGTTSALTYREARNALLKTAQDTAVSTFRDQVERTG
ncbi:hypothetical protein B5180_34825, partial [Streptomyces sp. BF-3]